MAKRKEQEEMSTELQLPVTTVRVSLDQWFAVRKVPTHHQGALRVVGNNSGLQIASMAEWDQLFGR